MQLPVPLPLGSIDLFSSFLPLDLFLSPQTAMSGSFSPKRVLSTEKSPSIPVIGSGNMDTDKSANRFKYDSLPKSIIKKNFGTEVSKLCGASCSAV
jgi:hypothetical protein